MDSYDSQRTYLSSSIINPKRVGIGGRGGSHVTEGCTRPSKRCVVQYFINFSRRREHVCKVYFSSLHGLSPQNSLISQIIQQIKEGRFVKKDSWGKHTNHPHKLTVDLKEKVRAHISSFPA